MDPGIVFTFHGTRGSMPVAGPEFLRFGGHTMCADISWGESRRIVVDCGTGIRRLEESLPTHSGHEFHILVTHYHHDHLQGLPFFGPLYEPGNTFTFYGMVRDGVGVEQAIGEIFRPPWFPVTLDVARADISYVDLEEPLQVGPVAVSHATLHHPQDVTAYRFDTATRSLALATDTERSPDGTEALFREWARGCDVLVHDGQYLSQEYDTLRRGWGHSTWAQAVEAAVEVGAGELVVVSHDPARTDEQLDELEARFATAPLRVRAAREGMEIPL